MTTVAITGASSLIGRALADVLTARGDRVVAFQRGEFGADGAALVSRVEQRRGDVRDPVAVEAAFADATSSCTSPQRSASSATGTSTCRSTSTAPATCSPPQADNGFRGVVHVSSPSVAHDGRPIVGGAADPPVTDHGAAWYPETKALAERWRSLPPTARWASWRSGRTSCGGPVTRNWSVGSSSVQRPDGWRWSAVGARWSTRPTSTMRPLRSPQRSMPSARRGMRRQGVRRQQRRATPDPGAGRGVLRGGRGAVRTARRAASGRTSSRFGHRSDLAAARSIRRATTDPIRRRATGHRALVRPACSPRRSRLGAVGVDRRGPRRARRLVRRRSHRVALPLASPVAGDVAEWFRQRPAKPSTRVRFPASPPAVS